MKTTRFLAALLAYCVVALLPARPYAQQSVDFATALDLARTNNPDWKSAEQEVEIARGKLSTARLISPFNPVLEGQGGPRSIPGAKNGTDYGVGLSMELEVAGQRGLRIGEAEKNCNGRRRLSRTSRGPSRQNCQGLLSSPDRARARDAPPKTRRRTEPASCGSDASEAPSRRRIGPRNERRRSALRARPQRNPRRRPRAAPDAFRATAPSRSRRIDRTDWRAVRRVSSIALQGCSSGRAKSAGPVGEKARAGTRGG